MEEAYELARSSAPELKIQAARIMEAEANVDRAWSSLKPQWNLSYTFTHVEPRPPELSFPAFPNFQQPGIQQNCASDGMGGIVDAQACTQALVDEFVRTIDAPPTVLDFARRDTSVVNTRIVWTPLNGRAIPLIQNAYDATEAEKDRGASRRQDLLYTVARAYYAAAATHKAISAATRAKQRADETLSLMEARKELGAQPRAAVLIAKLSAKQRAIDLLRAQNAHTQALVGLAGLLHRSADFEVVPPPMPQRPAGDAKVLLDRAVAQRRDLRAARTTVTMAERSVDELWWRLAPTLGVFTGFRYANVRGLGGRNESWSIGLTANMSLYDGGLRYADRKVAQARLRIAKLSQASMIDRTKTELQQSLLKLQAAELSVERAEATAELAKINAEVLKDQYEVGAARAAKLKEARDAVLDAEVGLIRAQMEVSLSVLGLQKVVGDFRP